MSVREQSGVSTLVGPPKEARASLSHPHADRVLVVSFDQVNLGVFEALAENIRQCGFSDVRGAAGASEPEVARATGRGVCDA